MNKYFVYIFILLGGLALAQSPKNTSINSGGETTNSLSFSVGQSFQGPFGANNLSGFQYINSDFESPTLVLSSTHSNVFTSETLITSRLVSITAAFSEAWLHTNITITERSAN
jgi:hypothetical protein